MAEECSNVCRNVAVYCAELFWAKVFYISVSNEEWAGDIMRMEQLRCLVDIAETHSITATAQRLFMTQPAVSKSIKQLEKEVGMELLVRTNIGVYLTEQGIELVAYARRILDEEQTMAQWIEAQKRNNLRNDYREIQICSASSITNRILPDVIAQMDPSVLSMKITSSDDIDDVLTQVQHGQTDIGLVTYNKKELYRKLESMQEDVQLDVLALDELVAVTQRKPHEDAMYRLEDLTDRIKTVCNVVVIESDKARTLQDTMIVSNDVEFHRRMIDKVGAMVIMPALIYQYFFNAKKYTAISLEEYRTELVHGAIYRKDATSQIRDIAIKIRREMYTK